MGLYIYRSSGFQLLIYVAPVADKHMWEGKNGEIMVIWCETNEVFREKHKPEQIFPTTSLTATDFELNNSQISITDLDLEIGTSQSFL